MTLRLGAYLHPWNLHELKTHAGLDWLSRHGLDEVSMASAYHAGRWTTPTGGHAPGADLLRSLEDGTVHFYAGEFDGPLQPKSASFVRKREDSPISQGVQQTAEAGLNCHAWTVLNHNSRLARSHPGFCVRNACGDVYDYALCPSQPAVHRYGLQLCEAVAKHPGLTSLELEAAGFMGYKHGSHHDKSSFAVDPYLDFLLSYCFCDACAHRLNGLGVDAEQLQKKVHILLHGELVAGDSLTLFARDRQESLHQLQADLQEDVLRLMLEHRRLVYAEFLTAVRQLMPQGLRLSVHLKMDPLFTGSQLGQPLAAMNGLVDEVIVTHYGESLQQMQAAWRHEDLGSTPVNLAFWPKAPQFNNEKELRELADFARLRGMAGLRIYHLGLLPWQTVTRVMDSLS